MARKSIFCSNLFKSTKILTIRGLQLIQLKADVTLLLVIFKLYLYWLQTWKTTRSSETVALKLTSLTNMVHRRIYTSRHLTSCSQPAHRHFSCSQHTEAAYTSGLLSIHTVKFHKHFILQRKWPFSLDIGRIYLIYTE